MPDLSPTPPSARVANAKGVLTASLAFGGATLALCFCFAATVEAQTPKKKPGGGTTQEDYMKAMQRQSGGGQTGPSGHGANRGGGPFDPMNPGGRGMGPGKKAAPKKETTSEEIDNVKLPKGYTVPQEPPEAFTTTEEWIEDPFGGVARVRQRMLAQYTSILTAGDFANEADKQLVTNVLRWKLSQLTRKEDREKATENRQKIFRDLSQFPSRGNPRKVRIHMLKQVAEEAPKLFQYHFVARLNGAILLADLADINETDAEGKVAAVPCTKAYDALLDLVKDSNQLTAVRVWGVNGLVRLAVLPELPTLKRYRLVDTLVSQMNGSAKEHDWYQFRLAEGLGRLTVIQNADKHAVVPQALALVLADPSRPWLVRAEAAQSLGRLPYESAPPIDLGLLAYETAQLAQQMTEAYNKEPKLAIWRLGFMKVYGAFKPLEEEDARLKRGFLLQIEKPALASHKRTVQEAFDVVLPLVAKVVVEPAGIDAALANLRKWLDQNVPKSFKLSNELDPIVSKQSQGTAIQRPETAPQSADANGHR